MLHASLIPTMFGGIVETVQYLQYLLAQAVCGQIDQAKGGYNPAQRPPVEPVQKLSRASVGAG